LTYFIRIGHGVAMSGFREHVPNRRQAAARRRDVCNRLFNG
jgi:hypothetical protein